MSNAWTPDLKTLSRIIVHALLVMLITYCLIVTMDPWLGLLLSRCPLVVALVICIPFLGFTGGPFRGWRAHGANVALGSVAMFAVGPWFIFYLVKVSEIYPPGVETSDPSGAQIMFVAALFLFIGEGCFRLASRLLGLHGGLFHYLSRFSIDPLNPR